MALIDPRNVQAIVLEALRQSGFSLSGGRSGDAGGGAERVVSALLEERVARGVRVPAYRYVMERIEKPLIEQVLAATGGNQLAAARLLGINRNTLRARIGALGIRVGKPGATSRPRGT